MEKEHRHRHYKHRLKAKEDGAPGRVNRHHVHPSDSAAYQAQRSPRDVLASNKSMQKQLRNSGPFSTDKTSNDGYIQRWLIEAQGGIAVDDEGLKEHLEISREHDRRDAEVSRTFTHLRHALDEPEHDYDRRRQRRRRNSSSDSSLLKASLKPRPPMLTFEGISKTRTENQDASLSHSYKKRRVDLAALSAGSANSRSSPRKETFEKRARHKTREELYNPRIQSRKHAEPDKPNRTVSKRQRKGDRNRASKRASEDLMHSFTSKSIGGERLTIRPSYGVGLFNNGRASYPAKRKGLSDLAFSEMEFLQRSNRRSPSISVKDGARSLERERERPPREQEISAFFSEKRMPQHEVNSYYASRQSPTYNGFGEFERRQSKETPRNFQEDRPPFNRDNISVIGRMPSDEKPLGSSSKLSGKATTYVTWSETQFSPMATNIPRRHLDSSHRRSSLTPESIRNSLEITGVYRNTGIERQDSAKATGDIVISDKSRHHPRQGLGDKDNPQYERDFRGTRESSTGGNEATTICNNRDAGSSPSHGHRPSNPPQLQNSTDTRCRVENALEEVGEVLGSQEKLNYMGVGTEGVVNHDKPQLEEHQVLGHSAKEVRSPAADPRTTVPEKAQSTPINREQLAKHARIKRPSTALPAAVPTDIRRDLIESNDTLVDKHDHTQSQETCLTDHQIDMQNTTEGTGSNTLFGPTATNTGAIPSSAGDYTLANHQLPLGVQKPVFRVEDPQETLTIERCPEGCIPPLSWMTQSNNSRNQRPNTPYSLGNPRLDKPENLAPLALPLRGGWKYNLDIDGRRVEPVYVRQAQQDYHFGGLVEVENSQKEDEIRPIPLNDESATAMENLVPNRMSYDETGAFQDDAYHQPLYDTDSMELICAGELGSGEVSEQYGNNCLAGAEDPEIWSFGYEGYAVADAGDDRAMMPVYIPQAYHNNYGGGDRSSTPRFWTPHRQY